MPTYQYTCHACGLSKDVFHSMKELETPTEETLIEISCQGDCEMPEMEGLRMNRDVTVVAFGKFSAMKPNEKQAVLKKRASEHYKKDIHERKVEMTKTAVEGFKKKFSK